jgi:hypothetical protein
LRGKVGRIGFDEDTVERKGGGDVAERLRFGVGDVGGEGNVEAEFEALLGLLESAGEAVENTAAAVGIEVRGSAPVGAKNIEAIGPGVAAVNHDGELSGGGEGELAAEDFLLGDEVGVFVMIVESNFAAGEDSRVVENFGELVEVGFGGLGGFVRVNAGGGVDPVVSFGEGEGGVEMVGAGGAADGENGADARVASASEDGVAVIIELRVFEVGV